jgi:hypothetical protein
MKMKKEHIKAEIDDRSWLITKRTGPMRNNKKNNAELEKQRKNIFSFVLNLRGTDV